MAESKKRISKTNIKKNDAELITGFTAVIKADSQILTNALEQEDGFTNDYGDGIIAPEIAPEVLCSLVEQNNTLNQCIAAMEVNIDGTGYDFVRVDNKELSAEDEEPIENLHSFMDEVYPMKSLSTTRRENRRYLESCGYSAIEVIRNPRGELVFFRALDSKDIRLKKLGAVAPAKKTLTRGGFSVAITVQVRERVFVQKINGKKVFFSEFGSSQSLNKTTGEWAPVGTILPFKDRASEIIYMVVNKSSTTPYGVPRWINNLPSVIGSRQAEELNLEFFNSGGIPPLLILIAGGHMGEEARTKLTNLLAGKAKDKLRGLVADVHSTSGSIEKGGGVSIQVETFDSAKQNDSMFENYDVRCEQRVRSSFRLPPLFVGKADDYSFASVFASYTVAEAQVFNPERNEFDELFNSTIMKSLENGVYKIKSKPVSVSDAGDKFKALDLAVKARIISKNQLRLELNTMATLNLPMSEEDEALDKPINLNGRRSNDSGNDDDTTKLEKSDIDLSYLGILADTQVLHLLEDQNEEDVHAFKTELGGLTPTQLNIVHALVSAKIFKTTEHDPDGLSELCACVD